jgi:hypothetical protein
VFAHRRAVSRRLAPGDKGVSPRGIVVKERLSGRRRDDWHTPITELGESGAGDKTIMEIAGRAVAKVEFHFGVFSGQRLRVRRTPGSTSQKSSLAGPIPKGVFQELHIRATLLGSRRGRLSSAALAIHSQRQMNA